MSEDVSIGSRIRGVAIAITLLVAATAVYVATQQAGHTVRVTGIWTPSPRLPDGVHVFVVVGRSNKVDRVRPMGPFDEVYPAESGDKVLVRLTLMGTGVTNVLACSVVIDGLEEFKTPNPLINHSRGTRECWGIVP